MQLTTSQLRAVTTDSRDVLVIAPAGSGKTRVVVERIAHLLTVRGVKPWEILCLTFTRRAAGEMRERLLQRLRDQVDGDPVSVVAKMLCGTFHSVALTLLTDHGSRIGYESLTVITEDDSEFLLQAVCQDFGYCRGKKWREGLSAIKVRAALDRTYTSGVEPGVECERIIVREYKARLYSMQCLDFGSILLECRRLFSECPDVLATYRKQIKHVLVDELQDSDAVQFSMHDWFAPPATFFGVGDRRQSVYGFRGARPDLMRERHPDAEVIDLRECWRCGDSIVAAANRLIAHNGDTLAQPMIGATDRAGIVREITGRSADVAAMVRVLGSEGYAWSDIAVLARRHSTLERLADAMVEAGIPHHRVGAGADICKGGPFLELHAALRLCINPRDRMAELRLKRMPEPRRDVFIATIRSAILSGDGNVNATDVGPAACDIMGRVTPEVVWWQEHCPDTHIADALRWYAIMDAQDDLPRGNVVTLATIHAAKGLEWPAVIVANCLEGELPGSRAIREPGGVEEERRVMYVAETRAAETLLLHWRRPEDQSPDGRIQEPSRFLGECMA